MVYFGMTLKLIKVLYYSGFYRAFISFVTLSIHLSKLSLSIIYDPRLNISFLDVRAEISFFFLINNDRLIK